MCRFYEMKPKINVLGDDKAWDDEKEDEWNGCCEDDDEEDNEKEWCD